MNSNHYTHRHININESIFYFRQSNNWQWHEQGQDCTAQLGRNEKRGGMQPGFRPRLLKARPSLLELMRASNSQGRPSTQNSVSDTISEDQKPAADLPADKQQQQLQLLQQLQEIASHPLPPETPASSSSATFTSISPPSTPAPPARAPLTTTTTFPLNEPSSPAREVPNNSVTPSKMPPVSFQI